MCMGSGHGADSAVGARSRAWRVRARECARPCFRVVGHIILCCCWAGCVHWCAVSVVRAMPRAVSRRASGACRMCEVVSHIGGSVVRAKLSLFCFIFVPFFLLSPPLGRRAAWFNAQWPGKSPNLGFFLRMGRCSPTSSPGGRPEGELALFRLWSLRGLSGSRAAAHNVCAFGVACGDMQRRCPTGKTGSGTPC